MSLSELHCDVWKVSDWILGEVLESPSDCNCRNSKCFLYWLSYGQQDLKSTCRLQLFVFLACVAHLWNHTTVVKSDAGFIYFLVGDAVTGVGSINMCADIL